MTRWICHPLDNKDSRLVPVFRRKFKVRKAPEKAMLRLTAHGVYEAEINGRSVTKNKLMPGLTSYYTRIQVQEYDVTALLQGDDNELRVTVGDGWWRWNNNFGYTLALWGELTLRYADGSEEVIATDERFEVTTDGIVRSDPQKGEVYDARIEPHGWQKAAFCTEHTEGELIENQSVPVREKERFQGKPMRDIAGNLPYATTLVVLNALGAFASDRKTDSGIRGKEQLIAEFDKIYPTLGFSDQVTSQPQNEPETAAENAAWHQKMWQWIKKIALHHKKKPQPTTEANRR